MYIFGKLTNSFSFLILNFFNKSIITVKIKCIKYKKNLLLIKKRRTKRETNLEREQNKMLKDNNANLYMEK